MCTHEIWTYSECGCRYDHHITCFDALAGRENNQPEPRPSYNSTKQSSTRAQCNSSPVKLPPSPSPTDSEDEEQIQHWRRSPQRSCSVNRTVHKTFLEPICHDCLITELAEQHQKSGNKAIPDQPGIDNNLIWESDVKIEVDDSTAPTPGHTRQNSNIGINNDGLEGDSDVRVSDSTRRRSFMFPNFSRRADATREPSAFSTEDADSESSAPSITNRGRTRTRSKQLRRMAMDVSREDLRLRVSSRLPSFQKKSLQSFKDELQRGRSTEPRPIHQRGEVSPTKKATTQPLRSFMQRLTDAQGGTWLKAKDAVNDFGRKMSRKSPSPKREARQRNPMSFGIKSPIHKASLSMLKKEIGDYNRAVDASSHSTPERPTTGSTIAPESFYLQPNDPFYPVIQPSDKHTDRLQHTLPHTPVETWRMHLEQDLTTPRQRKHRPFVCSPLNEDDLAILDGRAQPMLDVPDRVYPSGSTSTTAVSGSTASGSWQSHPSIGSNPLSHQSYEYPASHDEESESKRRLLSVSTLPSMPETAVSESFSVNSADMHGHRIASLVSDGDFDHSNDHDLTVGVQNIEREMAMVGLTENPWRQAILSSAGTPRSYQVVEGSEHNQTNGTCSNDRPNTPSSTMRPASTSPPTAVHLPATAATANYSPSRTAASRDHVNQDLTTLSGLPNTVTLRHRPTYSGDLPLRQPLSPVHTPSSRPANPQTSPLPGPHPSPSPSPATPQPFTDAHQQLALHALSTPFHHSLAPKPSITSNETLPSTLTLPPSNVASNILARPKSAPQPISIPPPTNGYRTIAHTSNSQTTPEAPEGFALGMKSPGVAGLFGCVWVRELCPGHVSHLKEDPNGEADDGSGLRIRSRDLEERDVRDGHEEQAVAVKGGSNREYMEGGAVAAGHHHGSDANGSKQGIRGDTKCGRVTHWRVRSCLCSGRVRTVSTVTVAAPETNGVSSVAGGASLPTVPEEDHDHSSDEAANQEVESTDYGIAKSDNGHKTGKDQKVEAVPEGRLDAECRSVAPVVRYVVGEELCAGCCRE